MHAPKSLAAGFTLVEILVILVIAGFLGVVVVNLLSTQLTKSAIPLTTTQNAANVETAMENVVSFYTTRVNTNVTTALANVKTQYSGNSTVSMVDATYNSVPVLVVTVTVGDSSLTTVLTQERTNALDGATTY